MPDIRFCLFIDGLDKYEGLPNDIIDKLRLLAKSESIKLCISSRPWTVFQEAFAAGKCDASLLLEQHTKHDIERFVRDLLEKNEIFFQAEQKDMRYSTFVDEVIEKARGVFLWVQLVVSEILKGLGEKNKLADLQDKLNAMPGSLKKYFRQMFDRIDTAHRAESAKAFLLTTYAVQPLPVECYNYLEAEHREAGYALSAPVMPMFPVHLRSLHEDVRNRINFLCKDLLEVNEILVDQLPGYQDDFLHRTVRDFLMTKDIYQELVQRATEDSSTHWDVHQSLCYVHLAKAKTLTLEEGVRSRLNVLFTVVDALIFYAHEVEIEQNVPQVELLDQLDGVITTYASLDMACHWTNARDTVEGCYFNEATHNSFLALAVQSRLVLYVTAKLNKNPSLLRKKNGRPLLDYALRPNIVTPIRLPRPIDHIDFEMVQMLLGKSADPNQKVNIYNNLIVWGLFLLSCYEMKDNVSVTRYGAKDTWFKAAEMMIRKGADRKLKLETTRREKVAIGSEGEAVLSKTAKHRKVVTQGGMVEMDVPIEINAISMLTEVFGDGKIAEIEAIVPEEGHWSWWSLMPWR